MPDLRHSRATLRSQRERVATKRTVLARALGALQAGAPLDGRLAGEQIHCGCRRARCGVCHPSKRWMRGADRQKARRAWQRAEGLR